MQYKVDAEGMVVYKNANQEAIRIFDYTPEEFWKVKKWRLADLIAPEEMCIRDSSCCLESTLKNGVSYG